MKAFQFVMRGLEPRIPLRRSALLSEIAGTSPAMTRKSRKDTMGLTREIGEFIAGMNLARVPAGAVETVARGFTESIETHQLA